MNQISRYATYVSNNVSDASTTTFERAVLWNTPLCSASNLGWEHPVVHAGRIALGSGIVATGMYVKDQYAYMSADSSTASKEDFYVINIKDPESLSVVSKISTGPGASGLVVVGSYVYLANMSATAQLQILDISHPETPFILSSLKLKNSTSTPISITYDGGYVFLGMLKNSGSEVYIIDVRDALHPVSVSDIEIGSGVNAIAVHNGYMYLGLPHEQQIRVFDVKNPAAPYQSGSFTSAGWQTQEGTAFFIDPQYLYFGRSVGGFNNSHTSELFALSYTLQAGVMNSIWDMDIGQSVYGIFHVGNVLLVGVGTTTGTFRVIDQNTKNILSTLNLPARSVATWCEYSNVYVALNSSDALRIITTQP